MTDEELEALKQRVLLQKLKADNGIPAREVIAKWREDPEFVAAYDEIVAETMAMKDRRERGFDDLAAVIEAHYGPRCTRNQGGCVCCSAWAIYDCLERLLDNVGT